MTKQEFLETVLAANEASVEVFKTWVDQIEEPKEEVYHITRETLDTIIYEIVKNINSLGTDLVNSYELSMYHNEVQLEDIEIDESEIESIVKAVIEDNLEVYEG
jgi:hypothetical protein